MSINSSIYHPIQPIPSLILLLHLLLPNLLLPHQLSLLVQFFLLGDLGCRSLLPDCVRHLDLVGRPLNLISSLPSRSSRGRTLNTHPGRGLGLRGAHPRRLLATGCRGGRRVLLRTFVLLEYIVIIDGKLGVHSRNRLWQLRNELSGSAPVDSIRWHNGIRRKH